jgi:FtsZ-interacting cell division protein ZipA
MSTATLIIGAVVIVAILIVAAWLYSSRQRGQTQQRSGQLRERFGSEYDRTVAEKGDTRSAERELTARQKRLSSFHIKALDADEGKRFSDEWQAIKASFVDDPSAAVRDAEALLGRVMDARGYPTGDFEQRSADISVDHSTALEHFRSAHEISLRNAKGEANTEDLRQAVINDHDLFAELIGEPVATPVATEVSPDTEEVAVAVR